jgi:mannose-6-phosphate isomerase
MLYPLIFHPVFKERVWGGRKLELLYHKSLPARVPIGESWELRDRPGDASVIANGPLAGKDLHWLMQHHGPELLGSASPLAGRFPLLIKILDAQEKLSLQVHPPADKAAALGGEPKTEMWYITDAAPGAELYVGLKQGLTRPEFEQKIKAGAVAECFHRVSVRAGDAMFLPSGRVHAIGAGLVIFEIQQNSDTTYRVFDWNRVGLDGKPRQLHVAESLASIDFNDFEPALVPRGSSAAGSATIRPLVDHPLFKVDEVKAAKAQALRFPEPNLRILGVVKGEVTVSDGANPVQLAKGQFCLIPASLKSEVRTGSAATFLMVQLPASS